MSDEQYALLVQTVTCGGPQLMSAATLNVQHLDAEARREVLSGYGLRASLTFASSVFAGLDAAAQRGTELAFEKQLIKSCPGEISGKVLTSLRAGNRMLPPTAVTQLMREIIEWCPTSGAGQAHAQQSALDIENFLQLILSINDDQQEQVLEGFSASIDTPEQHEKLQEFHERLASDDALVEQGAHRHMLWEFARLLANAIALTEVVLADTYETWFKGWPKSVPHNLIGPTPVEAFRTATGTQLRDFINLGLRLWEAAADHPTFTRAWLTEHAPSTAALALMEQSVALPLAKYRKALQKERTKGDVAHRRYTFTQHPVLQLSDDEFIMLRPAWVLERFCGPQLYWETFFRLGAEDDPRGAQFSQCMNYVFEANVDYLLRRITKRSAGAITLIPESQMQQAWTTSTTPSVCDWVLVSGRFCLLIDATNHWLDANLAQGLAQAQNYRADIDEVFIGKKFLQLRSTIEQLRQKGWPGRTFDKNTIYIPLVVVPNAGIPATGFADLDIKIRAHAIFGDLGLTVTSPAILPWYEMQLLEGIAEHRKPHQFVELLANWRLLCTGQLPVPLQVFLEMLALDRPLGTYPKVAHALMLKQLASTHLDTTP